MKQIEFCVLFGVIAFTSVLAVPSSTNILLVYVNNWTGDEDGGGVQDSQQIAQYYSLKYSVPAANILGIDLTNFTEFQDYANFYNTLVLPLNNKISSLEAQNVEGIVLFYPMPIRIKNHVATVDSLIWFPSIYTNATTPPNLYTSTKFSNTMMEMTPGIGIDKGRFNSTQDIDYFGSATNIYPVTRVDGPGKVWGIMNRIAASRYANKFTWFGGSYQNGNIYIDNTGDSSCGVNTVSATLFAQSSVTSGSYATAAAVDANIACGAWYLESDNALPIKHQACSSKIIGESGVPNFADGSSALTAPKAQVYGGWNAAGNYKLDAWEWLPGSIACDMNNGSLAGNIRSPSFQYSWAWGALQGGVTATAGVVEDAELDGNPRPNVMIYYYIRGFTFAEIALLSVPSFSWKSIYVGDPLLNPFAKGKSLVTDTQIPTFAIGSPSQAFSDVFGHVITVVIDDSVGPEIVKATVSWGTNSSVLTNNITTGWGSWHQIPFTELPGGTIIYYQVTIVDPAGLSSSTNVKSFTSSNVFPNYFSYGYIPGLLSFSDFDLGGSSISYYDVDSSIVPGQVYRSESGVELLPYIDHYSYSVTQTFPSEWLGFMISVGYSGLYEITVVMDSQATGSGFSQLFLNDINITQPILTPEKGNVTVQAILPTPSPGTYYSRLKWKCIQPIDPEIGCGSYSYMNFVYFSPSPTPSKSPVSPSPTRTPSPSVPPSNTPSSSRSPSPSVTPTVTPSISVSSSVTPSLSVSPSTSPSPSITPSLSVSPSNSKSPSATPSVSPSSIYQIKKVSGTPAIPIAVSVSATAFCALVVAGGYILYRMKRPPPKPDGGSDFSLDQMELRDGSIQEEDVYLPIGSDNGSCDSGRFPIANMKKEWIINFKDIKLGPKIGAGAFGEVYKASWQGVAVAVKQLFAAKDASGISDFFAEAELMQNIRPHPNITLLMGVCTVPLCIVTEFVGNGSLCDWFQSGKTLDTQTKIEIVRGTAAGILQLHNQGVVHRDLAARNILLDSLMKAKVSDFGMSRVVLKETNTTRADTGPIKWMAPEALLNRVYNNKTDVWSYGVVIFEVLTEGLPYPSLMATEVAVQLLAGNLSLVTELEKHKKEYAPVLVNLMRLCLQMNPDQRPDFKQIIESFE